MEDFIEHLCAAGAKYLTEMPTDAQRQQRGFDLV